MKVTAFVPIKLHSNRLPNKMMLPLGGRPLFTHIFENLQAAQVRSKVEFDIYCFCSDETLIAHLPTGVKFLKRNDSLDSADTIGIEIYYAFAREVKSDIYILCHATSPFTKPVSITTSLQKIAAGDYDSAFSAKEHKTFCWYRNKPVNYVLDHVPQTQLLCPVLSETSAFYMFQASVLNSGRRIGDKPFPCVVGHKEAVDIDDADDFALAEAFCKVEEASCVLCGHNLVDAASHYDGPIRGDHANDCRIVRCHECGHVQLVGYRSKLAEHYDNDGQTKEIVAQFGISCDDVILRERMNAMRLMRYLKSNEQSILDIGAGYCTFAKVVSDELGVHVTCLEPSKTRTDIGAKSNNITDKCSICTLNRYLDADFAKENKQKFDLVTAFHVFEHLDGHSIDAVLKNMYQCCKTGGRLLIEVPNLDDELLHLPEYQRIAYMIHHISYFNEDSLTMLLSRHFGSFSITHVQRYGYRNYQNWVHKLGERQHMDMNNDTDNLEWLNTKKQAKNTDCVVAIIDVT